MWRRRWSLIICVLAVVAAAAVYAQNAKPVYRSSARLLVDLNAPKAQPGGSVAAVHSDNYVQTQVDAIGSTSVLARALASIDFKTLKTFANRQGEAAAWLKKSKLLSVEAARRSDVITVSMDAPDPREAAVIVTAVVDAYLAEMLRQRSDSGVEILNALRDEKKDVDARRDEISSRMVEQQRRHGVMSFGDDRGNVVRERMTTLSASLTTAQLATAQLKARRQALTAALRDPSKAPGVLYAQMSKDRESGDREYDDLRSQIGATGQALAMSRVGQGSRNRNILTLETRLEELKSQLRDKEIRLAESYLAELATELEAAEQQQQQIRTELDQQQKIAMSMSADVSEGGKLAAEVDRLQKQSDALASRILDITVNSARPVPLNVSVLDRAAEDPEPIKPQKKLILLGAFFVGALLGLALAMWREMRDMRIRGTEEIIPLLGVPVITMVPPMNKRLSPAKRGQIVRLDPRCTAAEAYRGLRTSLNLGSRLRPKIILVTSAESGEGKSTTASNLAVAFAEAGESTLLIDCDLREPVQHVIFEEPVSEGLSNVLAGESRLSDVVLRTAVPQLCLLPCGPVPRDPAEQLASKKFTVMIQRLSGAFDRIIIDSPPVTSVTDAQILAASADATLIVLRMDRSLRHMVAYSLDVLQRVGAQVAGVVANEVVQGTAYRSYYGQAWQYSRSSTDAIVLHQERAIERPATLELIDDATVSAAFAQEEAPAWKGDDE